VLAWLLHGKGLQIVIALFFAQLASSQGLRLNNQLALLRHGMQSESPALPAFACALFAQSPFSVLFFFEL
jgi:hypothetical protein